MFRCEPGIGSEAFSPTSIWSFGLQRTRPRLVRFKIDPSRDLMKNVAYTSSLAVWLTNKHTHKHTHAQTDTHTSTHTSTHKHTQATHKHRQPHNHTPTHPAGTRAGTRVGRQRFFSSVVHGRVFVRVEIRVFSRWVPLKRPRSDTRTRAPLHPKGRTRCTTPKPVGKPSQA